jgi:hypothetical protein
MANFTMRLTMTTSSAPSVKRQASSDMVTIAANAGYL